MDDVDRLFQSFKCGLSTPHSAVREKKRSKSTLKQQSLARDSLVSCSPVTPELSKYSREKKRIDSQSSTEKQGSMMVKGKIFGSGNQISPGVFYGSPQGVPPKRPTSLLRLLREIRVDLAARQKSELSKEVWATFPRQNEAMNFAKQHTDVRVFSYQDHSNGQRRFLVSTYLEFWRRYKIMGSKFRHHYEVIQEGLPCHLYFDLEFNKRDNAEKNGDEMVDLLISVVLKLLSEKYAIEGNEDWVVELDSSTAEKFSRHLIIPLPRVAFKDNIHVGVFVSEICSCIQTGKLTDENFEKLFVTKDSSSSESSNQLFVDTAVYSRNRCFRLALSSKAGKSSVLLPSGRFKCKDMCEEDMFMASLICNVGQDCEKLLVCKMDLDCAKNLQFDTEVNCNIRQCSNPQKVPVSGWPNDNPPTYMIGKSPFPSVGQFVESIASTGSRSGQIRSWYWFSELGLMVYSMSRNRYCERIGREHKSNHVIYVVDLRREVYYQKCHDPDCQGYRSPLRPIPTDLIPDSLLIDDAKPTELADMNFECQFLKNYNKGVPLYNYEPITYCSEKDNWWLEVIKAADGIEQTSVLGNKDDIEAEEDRWMAVEMTTSEAELTHSNLTIDGNI